MTARLIMFLGLALTCFFLQAQPDQGQDKGTKIIEKIVDEDGNVISERIYYEYEDTEGDVFDLPGSFDLEGLGFGELFGDSGFFKSTEGKAIMGVGLSFDNGTGEVVSVSRGSGAAEVDIRVGDQVISVEGVAVGSIEDVQDILADMEVGDEVSIIIFRDGEEITKRVRLGSSTSNRFFFDIPEEGGFDLDFFRGGIIDSLFQGGDFDLDAPNEFWDKFFNENFDYWDKKKEGTSSPDISERATLGIFIDEIGAGVIVTEVIPDSPAEKGGILESDVIVKINDKSVSGYTDVIDEMNDKSPGDTIKLEVERSGRLMTVELEL